MMPILLPLLSMAQAAECPACAVEKVRGNHRTIHTEIVIDAPPDQVWAVLTEWEALPEWSPSILGMQGDIRSGGAVTVTYAHPASGKELIIDHTLIYAEGEHFGWSDPVAGGVTDHHLYRVEAVGDGQTRFIQEDELRGGLLVRLLGTRLSGLLFDSYLDFNQALKERVESRAP